MWWKLRASKMEAHVRSAMLRNDTFEDTIRQLEMGMSNVKQELASRLSLEAQLVSQLAALKSELATTKDQAASLAEKYQLASTELEKRQGEASTRGDETQRARMAMQRKTELLSQQKAKVSSLQQELEQASKKLERLATAEKQAALLQQKAKEHTQQLLHARQCYERCREDNVQLSIHLEKMKERHASIVARLKAARAENANLRTELKNSAKGDAKETASSNNQREIKQN
ncbi:Nuclear transcription factor Y subunit B [Phytophthora nicotianae]|uniref:Nuclear transcription factor Y subunit B n=1 Tax=Phytophthora nicotianae TaxID=4792 RepID=A0A0W8D0X9_PHYNI|nr:Nuclear transcription factor Y subunit B [Phytophthora nicotianae]